MKSCFLLLLMVLRGFTHAQSLSDLSASALSNHLIIVSWPYTNTAFTLEQSSGLAPGSTWQRSTLAPAFSSNTTLFSLSVPATNAVQYLRLARPADLRGIYVYSSDVSQVSSNYAVTLTNALNQPGVDGLVLVIAWSAIEPTNHIFHWTDLDQWMNTAAGLGKKIDLAIPAGINMPAWLFEPPGSGGAGSMPLQFTVSPHQGATSNCISETIAAPWDTNFLTAWNTMLTRLSAHLKTAGTYDSLTLLRLTGINRTTDELRLPAETPDGTGLDCVSNAPAIWQAAGYTPAKLVFGWSNIVSFFQQNFPDKCFSIAIIPDVTNSFPPIDNNGQLITNNIPDPNQPLLLLAGQQFAGQLVVQFNFLMTGQTASQAVVQSAQSYGTLAAYQSNNYYGSSGGGAACGGTPSSPVQCSNDTYLAELQEGIYPLRQMNSLRSQYIEVFPADVLLFTNAIWQAHSELFGAP